jgi:hypothetical protein
MGFIDKLFGHKEDTLTKQAKNLVSAANVFAVSLFVPTLDRFSILSEIKPKHWDFIVSVAGVFIAATRLNSLRLDSKREEILMDIVTKEFNTWDPDGIRAFEDCKQLFEMEYDRLSTLSEYQKDNHSLASDALGIWIVWNVFGRQPQSDEEVELVRVIGSAVTHAFFGWWCQA